MKIAFHDLVRQETPILSRTEAALIAVARSGDYICSPVVWEFEHALAQRFGVKHALAVASGTDALTMVLASLVEPGCEVITPAFGFFSTAAAIVHAGAIPIFVDVDPDSFNLDVDRLAESATPKTRAILPVHLFGQPADMDPILAFARQHDLLVIEDAAQAIDAIYQRSKVGTLGLAGCLSFNSSKNLGAYGNGGAVLTDDDSLAKRIRALRNYGLEGYFHHTSLGYNSQMSALQAAVLLVKLEFLDEWNCERSRIACSYNQFLRGLPQVVTPFTGPRRNHVFHKYTIKADRRDELQGFLKSRGIETKVYYPEALHLQPCMRSYVKAGQVFPVATEMAARVLSLPIYPGLTDAEVEHVAACIREFCCEA